MHLKVIDLSLVIFHELVRRTVSILFTLGHVFRHGAIVGPALSDTLANTPRVSRLIRVLVDTLQIQRGFLVDLTSHSIEVCCLSFSSYFNDIWKTSLMLTLAQLRLICLRYTKVLIKLIKWFAVESLGEDYFIVSGNTMVVEIGRPDEAIWFII